MKAIIRSIKDGSLEVYIPKKDLEAKVISFEKIPNGWGGIMELSNGWQIELPVLEQEPKLPITLEVKKIN